MILYLQHDQDKITMVINSEVFPLNRLPIDFELVGKTVLMLNLQLFVQNRLKTFLVPIKMMILFPFSLVLFHSMSHDIPRPIIKSVFTIF